MEHVVGSLRIRDNGGVHPAGWVLIGDRHNFDHMTYVISGKFRCKRYSENRDLLSDIMVTAPHFFNIAANEYHDFECIETGILHCIFASRDPVNHEVLSYANGWAPASGLRQVPLPAEHMFTTRQRESMNVN
jgi:hypothetical protein